MARMNPFTDTLHVSLQRSQLMRAVSLFGHMMAIGFIAWTAFSLPIVGWLIGPVVLSAVYVDRFPWAGWMPADGRFRWAADDRWYWQTQTGALEQAECRDAQCLGTLAVRLRLQTGRQRHTLLIPCDAVPSDMHRRLRARVTVRGRGARQTRDD